MSYREWITNLLLIGQAIAFLVFLSWIVYYDRVLITEPSPAILVLEFTLFTVIIALGVANLIKVARRRQHGNISHTD